LLAASKENILSTETATPEIPLAVVEVLVNKGKKVPVVALTMLMFRAVEAEALAAVIGTQVKVPAVSDCKIEGGVAIEGEGGIVELTVVTNVC
jgi:hypothetical protein